MELSRKVAFAYFWNKKIRFLSPGRPGSSLNSYELVWCLKTSTPWDSVCIWLIHQLKTPHKGEVRVRVRSDDGHVVRWMLGEGQVKAWQQFINSMTTICQQQLVLLEQNTCNDLAKSLTLTPVTQQFTNDMPKVAQFGVAQYLIYERPCITVGVNESHTN